MRGKLESQLPELERQGITPAGAGKTKTNQRAAKHDENHPRRCGENLTTSPQNSASAGSPPQVRGKPQAARSFAQGTGITPAGAGKTALYAKWDGMEKDHPRRCGENPVLHDFRAVGTGSPPQVRGKPSPPFLLQNATRITPAGAGKTLRREQGLYL